MITPNDATWRFIRDHRTDDVRQLALMGVKESEVDLPLALQQIQGWQTARTKLPSWAAKEEIVYPPHLNMEQCSSETTADYKRDLVKRLCMVRKTMADLTGGMGIDFSTLAQDFDKAVYVERNPTLCALMAHNGPVLGLDHMEIRNEDCADMLAMLPQQDLIFMDPARRDHHGGRVFQLQDCQPDVLSLREKLLRKARVILLKLSPMLDWHAAVHQLDCVREVHIVATGNECKELLLVCSSEQIGDGNVCCVNNGQRFCFPIKTTPNTGLKTSQEIHIEDFLYEPNAAVMKGGCFGMLCEKYKVVALGHDSHLFTSPIMMDDFPGRRFRIKAVSSFNKKELNRNLGYIKQANIAPIGQRTEEATQTARRRRYLPLCDNVSAVKYKSSGTYINDNGEGVTPSPLFVFELVCHAQFPQCTTNNIIFLIPHTEVLIHRPQIACDKSLQL